MVDYNIGGDILRSSDVCKLLNISRTALSFYVRDGKIKVTKKENGRYDYDDDSVYALRNQRIRKQSYLYLFSEPRYIDMALQMARNSIKELGRELDHTLIDTNRYKRENLEELINNICRSRVEIVFIRSGDLISESSEEMFEMLCKVNDVKLIIIK